VQNHGEKIAEKYLISLGYRILERNFRYKNWGEIDLICRYKNEFVFVEVRERNNLNFGRPEESVGREKFRKIARVARIYLSRNATDCDFRFEVVSIFNGKVYNLDTS